MIVNRTILTYTKFTKGHFTVEVSMHSQKEYLFHDKIEYDATKNKWIYHDVSSNRIFYYVNKPHWIEMYSQFNQILQSSDRPMLVRTHYDNLLEIAHKADNVYAGKLNLQPIHNYVNSIADKHTLLSLWKIFKLKLAYECKSSALGGSLPSSHCNQVRKYSAIVEALHHKLKDLGYTTLFKDNSQKQTAEKHLQI